VGGNLSKPHDEKKRKSFFKREADQHKKHKNCLSKSLTPCCYTCSKFSRPHASRFQVTGDEGSAFNKQPVFYLLRGFTQWHCLTGVQVPHDHRRKDFLGARERSWCYSVWTSRIIIIVRCKKNAIFQNVATRCAHFEKVHTKLRYCAKLRDYFLEPRKSYFQCVQGPIWRKTYVSWRAYVWHKYCIATKRRWLRGLVILYCELSLRIKYMLPSKYYAGIDDANRKRDPLLENVSRTF